MFFGPIYILSNDIRMTYSKFEVLHPDVKWMLQYRYVIAGFVISGFIEVSGAKNLSES